VKLPITSLLMVLLYAALPAGAQTRGRLPVPEPPLTVYTAPTPAPLAPPTNPGPAVAPPSGLSPLLAQPGPLFPTSRLRGPSYPASPNPAPVDQQKMQGYGNDLLGQRWQLERQGVSPDNRRFRELHAAAQPTGVAVMGGTWPAKFPAEQGGLREKNRVGALLWDEKLFWSKACGLAGH
jgi:hypothetical protein